jgi:hypothetical protein
MWLNEQYGILLSLFNSTVANATPDSNASTLAVSAGNNTEYYRHK